MHADVGEAAYSPLPLPTTTTTHPHVCCHRRHPLLLPPLLLQRWGLERYTSSATWWTSGTSSPSGALPGVWWGVVGWVGGWGRVGWGPACARLCAHARLLSTSGSSGCACVLAQRPELREWLAGGCRCRSDKWLDVQVFDSTRECLQHAKSLGYQIVVTHLRYCCCCEGACVGQQGRLRGRSGGSGRQQLPIRHPLLACFPIPPAHRPLPCPPPPDVAFLLCSARTP